MTVYQDFELIEAAIRNRSPAEIRSSYSTGYTSTGNNVNPSSSSGVPGTSPTSTPTHINNSYSLYELSMTIKGGARVSLFEVMRVMEIYEDMFSKTVHGFIEINDFVGGLSKFMITGGESINMTILKPMPSSEILIDRNDFIIYQISKVEIDDQNTMIYKLHFMSKSGLISQKKRLYRSFRNTRSFQTIIDEVYDEIAPNQTVFTKLGNVPQLQKTFVSPGYSPFETMDYLAKRACYNGEYYLFFERLKKINYSYHIFASIDSLRTYWEQQSSIPTILYQPITSHITPEDAASILSSYVQIQDNFDHINNMNSGFYNSRIRMLDPLNRKFYDTTINYAETQRLSNLPSFLENENFFMTYNSSFPEIPGERMIIRPTNDIVAFKSQWMKNDVYGSIMLSNMRINVDISGGNNTIGAGNIVDLKLPSFYAKSLNLEGSSVPEDIVYAGKYIVTAVRHIFDSASYLKKLELSRDSGEISVAYALNSLSNSAQNYAPLPPSPPPPPPPPPEPPEGYYYGRGGRLMPINPPFVDTGPAPPPPVNQATFVNMPDSSKTYVAYVVRQSAGSAGLFRLDSIFTTNIPELAAGERYDYTRFEFRPSTGSGGIGYGNDFNVVGRLGKPNAQGRIDMYGIHHFMYDSNILLLPDTVYEVRAYFYTKSGATSPYIARPARLSFATRYSDGAESSIIADSPRTWYDDMYGREFGR